MKRVKILLSAMLFAGFQSTAISQESIAFKTESNLVHRLPAEASGFLILNAYEHPDVSRWEITFLTPEFGSEGELKRLLPERTIELEGTYFTDKMEPAGEYTRHGFINIKGYNNSNSVIATDGPIAYACVGCDFESFCFPGCNGKTYAYGISIIGPVGGGSTTVALSSTCLTNGNPFYQYFSSSDWNTFCSNQTPAIRDHYGFLSTYIITLTQTYTYNPANADDIIKIPASLNNGNMYKNKNGQQITGDVYGIRKAKGIWDNYGNVTKNVVINPESFCDGGFTQANATLNSQKFDWTWNSPGWNEQTHFQYNAISSRPDLACNGYKWDVTPLAPSGSGSQNGGSGISAGINAFLPCRWELTYTWTLDPDGTILDANGNLGSLIATWEPCTNGGGITDPNDPWHNWPDLYESLTLSPASPDNTTGPLVINSQTSRMTLQTTGLPASNGDLTPGLYHALFIFADNSYISKYIFLSGNTSIPTTDKDHLTVVASPVPVTSGEFNLAMSSDRELNFNYKLMTTFGDVLFESEFHVDANEEINEIIPVDNYSETGVLINHIVFSDGSSKSFNITKL